MSSAASPTSSAAATSAPSRSSSSSTSSSPGGGLLEGTAALTGSAAFTVTSALAVASAGGRTVLLQETAAATCDNPRPATALHALALDLAADGGVPLATGNHAFGSGAWTLALGTLLDDGGVGTVRAAGGTLALTDNSAERCKGYFTGVRLVNSEGTDAGALTGAFHATACP